MVFCWFCVSGSIDQSSMTALICLRTERKRRSWPESLEANPSLPSSPPSSPLRLPLSPSSARTAAAAVAPAVAPHRTRRPPGYARTSATSARTLASTTFPASAASGASCTIVPRTRTGAAILAPALRPIGSKGGRVSDSRLSSFHAYVATAPWKRVRTLVRQHMLRAPTGVVPATLPKWLKFIYIFISNFLPLKPISQGSFL